MSGTIFGLGLSQRVDPNGLPEGGWKLYLYTAASETPVTAYKDTGLTAGLEHPWPIQADAYGMMPSFWLADGSYRARGVSNDGSRTFFDLSSVLALGASSGAGGGGASVDPNAIFATGDSMWQPVQGTRTGWVRDNGRTIGSATSGATERANADCQSLFQFYWNTYDTLCTVVGGRGASAAADWSANKQITTLDFRGYVPGGLDDMGNAAASRYSGVPIISGGVTTAGSLIGETLHTTTVAEMPAHPHTVTITYNDNQPVFTVPLVGSVNDAATTVATSAADASRSATATTSSAGGGSAHNIVQRTVLGTFFRKL